jgi:hypothetical protein
MTRDPAPIAVFRPLDPPPPGRILGMPWMAELCHPTDGLPYPLAVAWLSDFRRAGLGMVLDNILVPDHLRRRGYATALIAACHARWPDLMLTDPISPEGEGLLVWT